MELPRFIKATVLRWNDRDPALGENVSVHPTKIDLLDVAHYYKYEGEGASLVIITYSGIELYLASPSFEDFDITISAFRSERGKRSWLWTN